MWQTAERRPPGSFLAAPSLYMKGELRSCWLIPQQQQQQNSQHDEIWGEEWTILTTFQTFSSPPPPSLSLPLLLPRLNSRPPSRWEWCQTPRFPSCDWALLQTASQPAPGTGRGGALSLLISCSTGSTFLSRHWQSDSRKEPSVTVSSWQPAGISWSDSHGSWGFVCQCPRDQEAHYNSFSSSPSDVQGYKWICLIKLQVKLYRCSLADSDIKGRRTQRWHFYPSEVFF